MDDWKDGIEKILFLEKHESVYRMEYYIEKIIYPLFHSITGLYMWTYNILDYDLAVENKNLWDTLIPECERVVFEQYNRNHEGVIRFKEMSYFISFEDHIDLNGRIIDFFRLFNQLNENVLEIKTLKNLNRNDLDFEVKVTEMKTKLIASLKLDWALICDCFKEIMTIYVHGYR